MIVLSRIQKDPMDLETFLQNRITILQENTSINYWSHMTSEESSTDILSRGMDPDKLINNRLWFNGSTLLSDSVYPKNVIPMSNEYKEFKAEFKKCQCGEPKTFSCF
ncbi:uncharacterized protein NPIL_697661 [Nephila pilipes]|uniref:Uncharacterized protein n=1 Tax=Nephila pilipes TaxID=299642 RepID=A0A8X6TN87_NEPPI|nr:uncharacterized protein NPIL_697661 [Nephila pilipes]